MRTKYFKQNSLSDQGKKNLRALIAFPARSAEKIMDWLMEQNDYPRLDADDRLAIAERTQESGDKIFSVMSILHLFINRLVDQKDDIKDFHQDIMDLEEFSDVSKSEALDVIFARLPEVIEKFKYMTRKKAAETDGIPLLVSSTMSAAMKPILEQRFEYGRDKIEEYKPQLMGYTVVAQVGFQLHDNNNVFAFQMGSDDFNRLITDLLALQSEMRHLEEKCVQLNRNCEEN